MLASMSNAAGSGCSIAAVCVGAAECLVQSNHYTIKFSKITKSYSGGNMN